MPETKTKVKSSKKETTIKPVAKTVKKAAGIEVDVFGLNGKSAGKVILPKEIFGAKINDKLMAQAVRVYLANQRAGSGSTKTRGEVVGSTRKIYRQKGTGRARHGANKAPIFVGGGIAFGPKPRDFSLTMPKKMKRGALFSALSAKLASQEVTVVDPKNASKTREISNMLHALNLLGKKASKLVLVTTRGNEIVGRASRNIEGLNVVNAQNLTTYDVLNNKRLLFIKEAVDALKNTYIKA